MTYIGELISIGVAFSWTATALLSEFGSKRLGNLTLNVLRMALALVFSLVLFGVITGNPLPAGASSEACGWMLLSGLIGYVIGDFCLFQCYIIIGSRYGQLFMTLAPLAAALMAWITLGQQMKPMSVMAMLVTLLGIGISVLGRGERHKISLRLPLNGVLFAIGAALCQGIGLVLSKIGMDHYEAAALAEAGIPEWLVPFSANFYRCIAGIIGFTLLLYFRGKMGDLRDAIHDCKGMAVATATTIFGPFVGVGFSLMAVQYTAAGIASTLMAMTPIIILLPSYWLFHEKITWRAVLGAIISVVGVSLFFLG
ncbi:EamA-like transporter family protein [Xylanibacter ruminicola]|jgi:drug/metabolite transporter (DMT)-like permease|uniref:EamA-like transporter family protein n=1 Tax=Xylanibacter ruminicola TaxID=839 RepID=A0A1H5T418_XYLRU|nr:MULTISPECIES: DMT family transporter [Prevotellaceae]SEF57553.1 EamA-like transporter family protein [Xylanibacter ruminicola]SEV97493.1 EamA-like transporter family protein [Prevotella sp. khp7]